MSCRLEDSKMMQIPPSIMADAFAILIAGVMSYLCPNAGPTRVAQLDRGGSSSHPLKGQSFWPQLQQEQKETFQCCYLKIICRVWKMCGGRRCNATAPKGWHFLVKLGYNNRLRTRAAGLWTRAAAGRVHAERSHPIIFFPPFR